MNINGREYFLQEDKWKTVPKNEIPLKNRMTRFPLFIIYTFLMFFLLGAIADGTENELNQMFGIVNGPSSQLGLITSFFIVASIVLLILWIIYVGSYSVDISEKSYIFGVFTVVGLFILCIAITWRLSLYPYKIKRSIYADS